MDGLYECLTRGDITTFAEEGELYHSKVDKSEQYVFKDGGEGSKVLAVAHTDWVKYHDPQLSLNGEEVKCGQLDDRLGVWVLMYLLKQILPPSMPYDILLTDQEEVSNSTAKLFDPSLHGGKKYNWMFEFDRRGIDIVMYDYETPTLVKEVKKYGFNTAKGSFSDICYLSHLKCVGINVGTCYYGEHTDKCHANLTDLVITANMFSRFYIDNYEHKFRYNSKEATKTKERKLDRKSWIKKPNIFLPPPKEVCTPRDLDNYEYLTDKEIAQLSVDLGVTEAEAEILYYDISKQRGLTDFERDIITDLKREIKSSSISSMSDEEFQRFNQSYHSI